MFNPDNYGEEEFGPDDPKAKVKKTRKKKKVTKAIVVFGGAEEAEEAKKSVKASHNLKVVKYISSKISYHHQFIMLPSDTWRGGEKDPKASCTPPSSGIPSYTNCSST